MTTESLKDPANAFAKGRQYTFGPKTVSKEEIISFASEYDPIFFHTDEEAAKSSMLGGLIASGFHTCAITMRMLCESFLLASTSQGAPEVEEVTWHAPVRPDDTLSGTTTVLEGRWSKSRENLWIARLHHELYNQNGEQVLSMKVVTLFSADRSEA